jgi:hypothetical protein
MVSVNFGSIPHRDILAAIRVLREPRGGLGRGPLDTITRSRSGGQAAPVVAALVSLLSWSAVGSERSWHVFRSRTWKIARGVVGRDSSL